MSEQYYTPSPEDIRMGFVYERQDSIMTDMWRPRTITEWGHIFYVLSDISDGGYRVPYLTTEQIEDMGFQDVKLNTYNNSIEFTNFHPDEMYKDVRGHALFTLTNDDRHVLFVSKKDGTSNSNGPNLIQVYAGRCRCKNDLLMIMELCHVKSNINTPTTILDLKKHPLTPYE